MAQKKTVVVLQHVECEPPGMISHFLKRKRNVCVRTVKIYNGAEIPSSVRGADALLVLGGPMGVYEEKKFPFITKELHLIEKALEARIPVLGICLGSQLLAKATGGKVFPGGKKEIGWDPVWLTGEGAQDEIFNGFPEKFMAFHWHGDTFTLSKSCVHLAASKLFPMQAFRAGANAYGFQFHVEVTAPMIKEWTALYKSDRTEKKAGNIISGIPKHLSALNGLSLQLCKNFFTAH